MARNEARIFTSIWDDEDFVALAPGPQRLYLFLLSQKDMTYAGVLPLRPSRWAAKASKQTAKSIQQDLATLVERRFLVADEKTGEVLVRALVRRDGAWKQPNLMVRMLEELRAVESPAILASLRAEVARLDLSQLSDKVPARRGRYQPPSARGAVEEVMTFLGSNPSPNPSPKGSPNPSPDPSPMATPDPSPNPLSRGARTSLQYSTTPVPLTPTASRPRSEASAPDDPSPAEVSVPTARPEVEELCAHLARRIEGNGGKATVGKSWREAARLLIDRDEFTPQQVHWIIDWIAEDEFWRLNVLSMPALRKHRERFRMVGKEAATKRTAPSGGNHDPRPSTTDQRVNAGLALARKFAERDGHDLPQLPLGGTA